MDRRKIAILYYIAAAVCNLTAVAWFCSAKAGLGALWLGIGSTNLCLGSLWMKRSRDEHQED